MSKKNSTMTIWLGESKLGFKISNKYFKNSVNNISKLMINYFYRNSIELVKILNDFPSLVKISVIEKNIWLSKFKQGSTNSAGINIQLIYRKEDGVIKNE